MDSYPYPATYGSASGSGSGSGSGAALNSAAGVGPGAAEGTSGPRGSHHVGIGIGARVNHINDLIIPRQDDMTASSLTGRIRPRKKRKTEDNHELERERENRDLHAGSQDEDGVDGGTGGTKTKKTRQSPCRARKVKCDRPPPGSVSDRNAPTKDVCSNCSHLGLVCTFEYKPKKRGPPNMYVRRLQEEDGPSTSANSSPVAPQRPLPILHEPDEAPYAGSEWNTGPHWEPTLRSVSSSSSPIQPLSLPPTPYHPQPPAHTIAQAIAKSAATSQAHLQPYPATQSSSSLHPRQIDHNSSPENRPSAQSPHQQGRLLSQQTYLNHEHNPANPFDAVLPRSLLYHIIDLFYDYIYCLIPCLHRPTLIRDFNAKREEQPGEEEFTALILAIVASTLVQLPRNFAPIPRKAVKELVGTCRAKVKSFLSADFTDLTVARISDIPVLYGSSTKRESWRADWHIRTAIILYHSAFVGRALGFLSSSMGHFGENVAYVMQLRLNDESSYDLLDPLERAYRRRIYWLMYGADKSFGVLDGRTVWLHEDDCADVRLPEPIDDEYIEANGYLQQTEGYTPIMSGFYYISKLHRLTGLVLHKRRRDKNQPPTGPFLELRLIEASELYDQIMTAMDDCPRPLKLEYKGGSVKSLSPGWHERAKDDIRLAFADPHAWQEVTKDYFLVQQANCYVTQQMVRFLVLQYRDELLEIHEATLGRKLRSDERSSAVASMGAHSGVLLSRACMQDEKDEVAVDLLAILHQIPMPVLAINNHPIVAKVRYVASTLLDAFESNSGSESKRSSSTTQSRTQKAQANLWQYLNILSELEGYYSLETDD